jgi:hypothetical protein
MKEDEWVLGIPGVVKLTTSVFYTPLGHSPSNGGIYADIPLVNNVPTDSPSKEGAVATRSRPDRKTLLSAAEMAQIAKARGQMQWIRNELSERSHRRWQSQKVQAAQTRKNPELDPKDDALLGEAIRVARDWVELAASQPSVARY